MGMALYSYGPPKTWVWPYIAMARQNMAMALYSYGPPQNMVMALYTYGPPQNMGMVLYSYGPPKRSAFTSCLKCRRDNGSSEASGTSR